MGGMGFAMSNVLVVKITRTLPAMKPEMRTAVIFGGSAIIASVVSLFEPMPSPPSASHLGTLLFIVIGLGIVLASNNMIVQIGFARVPANRASIIMLFELVVTALSAWLFAGEVPGARVGGRRVHRRRVCAVGVCASASRGGGAGCIASATSNETGGEADDEGAQGTNAPAGKKKSRRAMV